MLTSEAMLYLIREELKIRKLFHALHQAGIDDCYFQHHLDSPILVGIGWEDYSDDLFNRYSAIMEKHSKKIEADPDSIVKRALKVYVELMHEKNFRQQGKQ